MQEQQHQLETCSRAGCSRADLSGPALPHLPVGRARWHATLDTTHQRAEWLAGNDR
jgi:hypothetical protein